jgi:hypothetical protein
MRAITRSITWCALGVRVAVAVVVAAGLVLVGLDARVFDDPSDDEGAEWEEPPQLDE